MRNRQASIFLRCAVQVLKKDNRLSITPVPVEDRRVITQML
jgi:predicted RNA-binding protein with PUA-like domain